MPTLAVGTLQCRGKKTPKRGMARPLARQNTCAYRCKRYVGLRSAMRARNGRRDARNLQRQTPEGRSVKLEE